jgi:hypothetical protein
MPATATGQDYAASHDATGQDAKSRVGRRVGWCRARSLHCADAGPRRRPILRRPVRWRPTAAAAKRGPRRCSAVSGSAFVSGSASLPAAAFVPGAAPSCATACAAATAGEPADDACAGAIARARPERGFAAASRCCRGRSTAAVSGAATACDGSRHCARPAGSRPTGWSSRSTTRPAGPAGSTARR